MSAILQITDGTTTIDLLNPQGFMLQGWQQAIPGFKDDGVWSDSPIADWRQLAFAAFANVIDEFRLSVHGNGQDEIIRTIQDLLRLLGNAKDYWTSRWATVPVYIKAQATDETNPRYAVVSSWRTPDIASPYSQPFIQPKCEAAIEDFSLFIEHTAWQDAVPGNSTCVQASAQSDQETMYCLEYTDSASDMDCGRDVSIDDMPILASGLTVEMWVYMTKPAAGVRHLIDKENWGLLVGSTGYLEGRARTDTVSALSTTTAATSASFNAWHHIAMTYDDGGTRKIRIWVDGVECTYITQTAATGTYLTDVGEYLHIGAENDGTDSIGGHIGWVRFTNDMLYTSSFTPPLRCVIPFYPGDSSNVYILLPMLEGSGTTVANLGAATADGTLSGVSWGDPCAVTYGRAATCNDEVYVANKHNKAQLTHVFWYDDSMGLYSVNLLGEALPYSMLPNIPAADDCIYFGVSTAALDSGPFCSLVFDLMTAISGVTGTVWEYLSPGAVWTAFDASEIQDNTNQDGAETGVAFDTLGVHSVHWVQLVNPVWITGTVNGVTGWWVRLRVTIAAGGASEPVQQNRQIYTVVIPYVDIDAAQVKGDIPALLRLKAHNQSGGMSGPDLFTDRLIVGLRSVSRGSNFTAFINLADEQNPAGILIALDGTDTAYISNTDSPCGRDCNYAPAADRAISTEVIVRLGTPIVGEYYGTYHAYLRGYQYGGVAGDIGARLVATMTNDLDNEAQVGDIAYTEHVGVQPNVLDLGQFTLPPVRINMAQTVNYIYLIIQLSNSNAPTADYFLFDLILIPVDEWAVDTYDNITSGSSVIAPARYISYVDIDSVTSPKHTLLSTVKAAATDVPFAGWVAVSAGPAILQANRSQRLWFFAQYTYLADGLPRRANHEICHSVRLSDLARYQAMRGNR